MCWTLLFYLIALSLIQLSTTTTVKENGYLKCCSSGNKVADEGWQKSNQKPISSICSRSALQADIQSRHKLCSVYARSCCIKRYQMKICNWAAKNSGKFKDCHAQFLGQTTFDLIATECCLCCQPTLSDQERKLFKESFVNCKQNLQYGCPNIALSTSTSITTNPALDKTSPMGVDYITTELRSTDTSYTRSETNEETTENLFMTTSIPDTTEDNSDSDANFINTNTTDSLTLTDTKETTVPVVITSKESYESTELTTNDDVSTVTKGTDNTNKPVECPENKQWDPVKEVCVQMLLSCPTNFILHPILHKCFPIRQPPIPCENGFTYNQFNDTCEDINECVINKVDICLKLDARLTCVNTVGSYKCQCATGFEMNLETNKCEDIDECLNFDPCPSIKRCRNTIGSYRCGRIIPCGFGWKEDLETGLCVDVNECIVHPEICGRGMQCVNIRGSHRCMDKPCSGQMKRNNHGECSLCRDGFEYNNVTGKCQDIDECQQKFGWIKGKCRDSEICVNIPGSYECHPRKRCFSGTVLSSNGTVCEDIDECHEMTFRCQRDQICINTYASYVCIESHCAPSQQYDYKMKRCLCKEGYRIKLARNKLTAKNDDTENPLPTNECEDINECDEIQGVCGSEYTCVNEPGSYRCIRKQTCLAGYYRPSMDAECKDVNECETGEGKCGPHMYCVNTVGSYKCMCDRGYILLHNSSCADINECILFTPEESCPDLEAKCMNIPGSYKCECPKGFYWSDFPIRRCKDINECTAKAGQNPCGESHQCINTIGSYRCVCNKGYQVTPEGNSCEDTNECYQEPRKCRNGICENKEGGYTCRCSSGLELDNREICQDVNECAKYTGICDNDKSHLSSFNDNKRKTCVNIYGYYKCINDSCSADYSRILLGNGVRCRLKPAFYCNTTNTVCLLRKPYHYEVLYLEIRQYPDQRHPRTLTRFNIGYLPLGEYHISLQVKYARYIGTGRPISTRHMFRLQKDRFQKRRLELVVWQTVPTPTEILLLLQVNVYHQSMYIGHAQFRTFLFFVDKPQ